MRSRMLSRLLLLSLLTRLPSSGSNVLTPAVAKGGKLMVVASGRVTLENKKGKLSLTNANAIVRYIVRGF